MLQKAKIETRCKQETCYWRHKRFPCLSNNPTIVVPSKPSASKKDLLCPKYFVGQTILYLVCWRQASKRSRRGVYAYELFLWLSSMIEFLIPRIYSLYNGHELHDLVLISTSRLLLGSTNGTVLEAKPSRVP